MEDLLREYISLFLILAKFWYPHAFDSILSILELIPSTGPLDILWPSTKSNDAHISSNQFIRVPDNDMKPAIPDAAYSWIILESHSLQFSDVA